MIVVLGISMDVCNQEKKWNIQSDRMKTHANIISRRWSDAFSTTKERIRKLHIECNKYIEIPSYLKRELAEIEFHNYNQNQK